MAGRRVVITGIASHLGTELARRLEQDAAIEHVAGIDTRPPRVRLERTEFIEADIRSPVVTRLLPRVAPDTLVHNRIERLPGPQAHDINVIGTLQLLAACEKTPSLEAIVIRGSAGIYGAEPAAPQFFTEEMANLYPLRTRFQRDVGEIENYFETFANRHPEVTCTMLRYQPAIGRGLRTQIARYLSLRAVPTYMGFDPRIQLIHVEDALDALVAAVARPVRGAVNVAAEGTIGLTRMIRMAGRPVVPIPHPAFAAATGAARRLGLPPFSHDLRRLLQHGRAVDVTRLVEEVGYRPRYTTAEAVADFAGSRVEAEAA
ncbi:MAG TPA: NAD-dependent epimerase/dehydratase family protein [Thermoleophilaceae bacterium]|nr:NAD-dependent epimerase/dehydratase family protein [Thermoleophilaceae bacterium]